MLLFIPAARLIVVVKQRPVVPNIYITAQALCQSTLRLERGVNGENQRRSPFGLKAMVAKEVCRVIGWALKCRLYLGRAMPSFFIRD